MSRLRNVQDTLLMLLQDNLPGVAIHALRFDKKDLNASALMVNALNVNFLTRDLDQIADIQVSLDILNDDEYAAVEWEQQVSDLFRKAAFADVMDYTDTSNPVATKAKLSWPPKVKFRTVVNEDYYHSTATTTFTYQSS